MKELARSLRKKQTDAESILWWYLRNRNLESHKFRRQHVIEPYILDFVCLQKSLVIELDGGQHLDELNQERDKERTEYLLSKGFRVVRFWNNEILTQMEAVLDKIYDELGNL